MGGLGEVEDIRKLKPAVESIKEQSKALVFCFGQSGALSARRGIPPRDRGRPWGPSGYTARSLSALRLSHRGASRVGRVEPSGPRGSSRSSFRSPSCRRAWKGGRGGAGGRHGGPASSHRGLQPAAPAERPSAAPVRRKRGWRRTRRRPFGELPDPAASAGPMADSSPAPSLRAGGPRAPRPSAPSPPPPHSRSGSEAEEAEQSLSLARTKTRSYGSTASVRAPLGAGVIERHVEHRVRAGDTLQGIALKYGVSVSRAGGRGRGRSGSGRGARGAGHRGAARGPRRLGLEPLAQRALQGQRRKALPGGRIEFPMPCPHSDRIRRVRQAKEDQGIGTTRTQIRPIFIPGHTAM